MFVFSGHSEVPSDDVLNSLPILVEVGDEPWVRNITITVSDGSMVLLWLEPVGCMVDIQWLVAGIQRVGLSFLAVTDVAVREDSSSMVWTIHSDCGPVRSEVTVRIGDSVSIKEVHQAMADNNELLQG